MAVGCLLVTGLVGGPALSQTLILAPDRVIDGRGGVLEGVHVLVEDGLIVSVGKDAGVERGARVVDLSGMTLLPGLVDTHVHIDRHFDADGKTHRRDSDETPGQLALRAMENAYRTLMGGVTTAQSLGSEGDLELREAIAEGVLPGPRLLTSVRPIFASTGEPEEIRKEVAALQEGGADVIKIFASASIRDGGTPTMSQEQLDAACGEAARRGLRAVVHAHGPESARRSVEAGCTTIEHGALLDRETLELMAANGVYYDPNIDLVLRNYFENKERFLGVGNYTEEGFAQMRAAVPRVLEAFKTALAVEGLKVVFGTDAVAGAHGRNVEELIYRIETGGQPAGEAIISATSLAAESLGLGDRIGTVAPGFRADLIAVEGDPLSEPVTLARVSLVMKSGRVVKGPVRSPDPD